MGLSVSRFIKTKGMIARVKRYGSRKNALLHLPPKKKNSIRRITKGRVMLISFVFMARTAERIEKK